MKKVLIFTLIMILSASVYAARTVTPSSWHFAKDHGDKTGVTLTNVITSIGTREARIILDGGQWTISNNVVIPTNVTLEVTEGSDMNVITNFTVGFQNSPLVAGDWQIFSGNGSATGTADFVYRWPSWGDTNDFNIGDGALDSAWMLNILTNLSYTMADGTTVTFDKLTVNDIATFGSNLVFSTAAASNSIFTVVTNNSGWDAAIQNVPGVTNTDTKVLGYINECVPAYVSTNSITVGTGDGMCNGDYFSITSSIAHTITSSIGTGTGFVHIAIDDSASTYPSTLSVYDTTNDPVEVPSQGGWYISTSQTDRVIATLRYHEAAGGLSGDSTNVYYTVGGKLRVVGDFSLTLQSNAAADGNLNATTTSASNFLPVNASAAHVQGRGAHAANNCEVYFAGNGENQEQRYEAYDEVGGAAWVTVDETRLIYVGGANGDDAALDCTLLGYEVRR